MNNFFEIKKIKKNQKNQELTRDLYCSKTLTI